MENPKSINEETTEVDIIKEKVQEHPHSDKEMLLYVGIKFLILFIIVFSFDFLIDLLLMLLDLVFEILHLLIELIDELLESLLKGVLPTSHHQNEVIIVNLVIASIVAMGLYSVYKLFRAAKYFYRLKRYLKAEWLSFKKRKALSWRLLPVFSKIKLVTAYCVGFSLLYLIAF